LLSVVAFVTAEIGPTVWEMAMKYRICLVVLGATVAVWMGGDLLACGDKFLVAGRGTRYQRPKNARAASVLIYANPSSGLPAALKQVKVDSVLKHEGHRSTTVETFDQLSAILVGGRFDVVVAASSVAADVEKLLGPSSGRAVMVVLDGPPKEASLLKAIDKAVEQHDKALKTATRS
jgi:hypothetical protein